MGTYYPSKVEQISDAPDVEVAWTATNFTSDRLPPAQFKIYTQRDLKHISNPATGDLRNQTWTLKYTDFNIPANTAVSGIQLTIKANRNGRIVDETVQLTYNDTPIGDNNFIYITDEEGHLPVKNETLYGGPTDLWGAEITSEVISDSTFGVILKFQSHPYYPHSCGMILESVALTIYE